MQVNFSITFLGERAEKRVQPFLPEGHNTLEQVMKALDKYNDTRENEAVGRYWGFLNPESGSR